MKPPTPLPAEFANRPFKVRDALDAGTGYGRLRTGDLDRPWHGVRAAHPLSPVLSYVPRLRSGDRFSHTTALALWGAPLPSAVEHDVHVTAAPRLVRPRARGVIGHRSSVVQRVHRGDLPVSDPATAFLESASVLGVDALVAAGDFLVLDPRVLDPLDQRPHTTTDELRAAAAGWQGRGAVQARAAAAAVRAGVESPMETALRLLLVRHGIPEPECGFELRRRTRRIGWFDLAWPEHRVIAEYDGDMHRTSTGQYERDIRRFDDASELGWRVIRVRKWGILRAPLDTVRRVERALAGSAGYPR